MIMIINLKNVAPNLSDIFEEICSKHRLHCINPVKEMIMHNNSSNEITHFPNNLHLTKNGNTGSFLASWDLSKKIAEQYGEDVIIYFVEDDYIHRRGAKEILLEAFRDLNATYVSLYDHPDKYQNFKDKRFTWDHGKQDIDVNGIRKPKHVYGQGLESKVYISKSIHWRTVSSTTMTWACRGKDIIEDFQDMWDVHYNKHLPMGGDTFRMLAAKGKQLISCIPSYAAHGEEKWLPYFVNWEEEAKL